MRLFLLLVTLITAIATGSIAARGQDAVTFLGRQMLPDTSGNQGYLQVRVQQRIIIRIPRGRPSSASLPQPGSGSFTEKKIGKCLVMDRFTGLRTGSGSKENLEITTRDGYIYRAYLGDGCLAREFYQGAYMERSKDGKICVERDLLHARTGAKCEIDKFRLLVPEND